MTFKTADLCDEHPDAVSVVESIFRRFGRRRRFHGPVATVEVHEDNVLVRQTLEEPGEGRVLVVDGGGSTRCALIGDVLAGMLHDNGWAGAVIHGCIRDSAEIDALDVGVLALGTNPRGSRKHGAGFVGAPIALAGVVVRPSDHIYVDDDGVVVAKHALTE